MNGKLATTLALAALAAIALGSRDLAGQELRLLPPERARWIQQEISGDAAYEHIRFMTRFHRPRGGADGLWEVARYVEDAAREARLAKVRLIKQAYAIPPWNARFADLWIAGPEPERLASTLQVQLHLADYSRATDVTAELVDVGSGTLPDDYAGQDVRGRVVLAYGPLAAVAAAAGEHGAAGVVWHPNPYNERNVAYPDQVNWSRLPIVDPGDPGVDFAFILSLRQGLALRDRLRREDGAVVVRAIVDAAFDSAEGAEPWQVMVEAFIPGTEPDLGQDVMLTAHIQEEQFSANDDASGAASLLEIGRAVNRLIEDGRIPRPRRNLRFWWVTEFSSQRQYFAENPDAHRRMWVNVNNDMVGANQAQDVMRVQNVTRLPASRFHFFNDVVEAVVDYLVASNNSELAQAQAGHPLYPNPHLARLGTRHRWNAKMVFYHMNTDHVAFNEAPIGVPGITFTNWPDHYIHTSDDDLWNIDATQLGRSAAASALIAYVMAAADDGAGASALAAETLGRGAERLARNLALGLGWIATGDNDRAAAYDRAVAQVRYAADRERRALRSLSEIGPGSARLVPPLLAELDRREAQALREIEAHYGLASGQPRPPAPPPRSAAEDGLAALRPALVAGPAEFLTARGRIGGVSGLHGIMAFEVLAAVDGERSGLDIYRQAAAQAREAGAHYYGTVTPDAVLQYLERVAEVGLIRLR